MPKPLLIVIAGPTASGKTDVAIEIAQHYQTEILSADSRQCYREMNIGVAKPSTEELSWVKHHFINSHSIFDEVNAGVYEQYALNILNTIFRKNNVAVLAGGTGLYIDALLNGIDEMPQIPDLIRKNIADRYQQFGLEWLQQQLKEKDATIFKTIDKQNTQRLMRALEVVEATGKSITEFRKNEKVARPFDTIKIALGWDRETLYQRINTRVDRMMQQGLPEEVETLLPYQHLNALQTVGYKELFDYYNNKCSLEFAIEEIKKNTRRYAKRQITWFKNKDDFMWITSISKEEMIAQISLFYKALAK